MISRIAFALSAVVASSVACGNDDPELGFTTWMKGPDTQRCTGDTSSYCLAWVQADPVGGRLRFMTYTLYDTNPPCSVVKAMPSYQDVLADFHLTFTSAVTPGDYQVTVDAQSKNVPSVSANQDATSYTSAGPFATGTVTFTHVAGHVDVTFDVGSGSDERAARVVDAPYCD